MRLNRLIQPFGAILATHQELEQITHISSNFVDLFKQLPADWRSQQFLGQDLSKLLPSPLIHDLCNACSLPTITQQPEHLGLYQIEGRILEVRLHCRHEKAIIEFEPQSTQQERSRSLITQLKLLFCQAQTPQSLLSQAARTLQITTDFEQVSVYRFLNNGSSEVVAEAHPPMTTSKRGKKYPATAIPQATQARLLQSPLRIVGHLQAALIPILADQTAAPLDLSLSHLQGYDEPFQEYPLATDTEANLAIAILIQEQLWGLFVLEHPFPKLLSPDFRDRIELFGQLVSLRLEQLLEQEKFFNAIPGSETFEGSDLGSFEEPRSSAESPSSHSVERMRSTEREEAILLVEDNLMLALELENTLQQLGFKTIQSAPSVTRALRLLEQQTFQLGLLDINLKQGNSFAIAEKLLQTGVPFAFTSGYSSDPSRPPSLQHISIVKKPIELEKLQQILGQLLV